VKKIIAVCRVYQSLSIPDEKQQALFFQLCHKIGSQEFSLRRKSDRIDLQKNYR